MVFGHLDHMASSSDVEEHRMSSCVSTEKERRILPYYRGRCLSRVITLLLLVPVTLLLKALLLLTMPKSYLLTVSNAADQQQQEPPASAVSNFTSEAAPMPLPLSTIKFPPGVEECGSHWVNWYAELHKSNMARGKRLFENGGGSYLIYDCVEYDQDRHNYCGGLGDMLLGIVASFTFALLTNRTFLIRAPTIAAGFYSPYFDWHMPCELTTQTPWFSNKDKPFHHYELHEGLYVTSVSTFNIPMHEAEDLLISTTHNMAPIIVHRGNRGVMHLLLTEQRENIANRMQQLGLSTLAMTYSCIFNYVLQPLPHVTQAIQKYLDILEAQDTFVIGIHIRTGDKGLNGAQGLGVPASEELARHGYMFQCADLLTKEVMQANSPAGAKTKVVWFLTSDSYDLKAEAIKVYGERIVATDFQPYHTSQRFHTSEERDTIMGTIIGEWILFSKTHARIWRQSGWAATSALMSASAHSSFIFPRVDQGKWRKHDDLSVTCSFKTTSTIEMFAHQWSGI